LIVATTDMALDGRTGVGHELLSVAAVRADRAVIIVTTTLDFTSPTGSRMEDGLIVNVERTENGGSRTVHSSA
jgi:hypothetical protein